MITRKFLPLLILVLLAQAGFSQTFNKAKLDSLLDDLAAGNNKAMISIALRQNGQLIYSRAIGYSVIAGDNRVPATTQTRYRIGSVTKVFTSVMVFQLIEEGKLKLSTRLSAFFPDLPNAAKITVANMLNHRSGLHNFTNDPAYLTMMTKKATEADLLAIFKANKSDFEPGTMSAYSNTNFVLLGYIVEKLDKKPYAEALKSRITNKIGLKDTYYGGKINPANKEARSYDWDNAWKPSTETDMSIPAGAGALVSTPTDLTLFMDALFTGKLVQDSSLKHMETINGTFGMDLITYPFGSKIGYGHDGGIDGFRSQAIYFPAEHLASAFTANGVNTNLNNVLIGMLSAAMPVTLNYTVLKLKPEDLDKFLGVYATPSFPLKITITKKGAQLYGQATGQPEFPLDASGPSEFRFEPAGIMLTFDPANSQMKFKQGAASFLFTKDK